MAEKKETIVSPFPAEAVKERDDRVTVTLFKDNRDYKDDQFVAVNGKAMKIQRGVAVSIPRSHAEVLQQSMGQDASTAMLVDSLNGKFECVDGKV